MDDKSCYKFNNTWIVKMLTLKLDTHSPFFELPWIQNYGNLYPFSFF